MAQPKKRYRVFQQIIQTYTADGHRCQQDNFVGYTSAVSPKQAVNNVKYILRCEGKLPNDYCDGIGYHRIIHYYAKEVA